MNAQTFIRLLLRLGSLVLVTASLLPQVATAQTSVKYIHTDALGSVVAMTDATGAVVEGHREYEAYGQQLTPAVQDGPGYTGHVQDAATGLVYMQQRYYDPWLGVFLSTDPVTAFEQPIHLFNRYRYANGNPYKFVDPDGRCTGTRIKSVCESGGPAGLHTSAREGIAGKATYEANRALHKAGAFRPYEQRAEMHRAFADAVEPVATRHGVEIAALTYRGRSGLWALGRAFSSGHPTMVVGLFDGHRYSQLQLMGYIHTHPNRAMFSGEGLSYAWGASDFKCGSASLDCSLGDIQVAMTQHVYAALAHKGAVRVFEYHDYIKKIEHPSMDWVPVSEYVTNE